MITMPSEVRLDKWLWAVRIYKTRSMAANACRKGRVKVDDVTAKPSRMVKAEDVISVKKLPLIFKYKVKDTLENRVAAKLVDNYLEDITPEKENNNKSASVSKPFSYREKGKGRPTKKERRLIDKLKNS
jgi:ribosome-associated heat shock protein Hsp15